MAAKRAGITANDLREAARNKFFGRVIAKRICLRNGQETLEKAIGLPGVKIVDGLKWLFARAAERLETPPPFPEANPTHGVGYPLRLPHYGGIERAHMICRALYAGVPLASLHSGHIAQTDLKRIHDGPLLASLLARKPTHQTEIGAEEIEKLRVGRLNGISNMFLERWRSRATTRYLERAAKRFVQELTPLLRIINKGTLTRSNSFDKLRRLSDRAQALKGQFANAIAPKFLAVCEPQSIRKLHDMALTLRECMHGLGTQSYCWHQLRENLTAG